MGKFELDEPISQERALTLSNDWGLATTIIFLLRRAITTFFAGIGGVPSSALSYLGHTDNDYTRYSVAVVSSNNGQTGLPSNQTYDVYTNFTQGFEVPRLGLQQVGVYGYFGESPTYFQTSGGNPIPGTGMGNRSFYRAGAYGHWYCRQVRFPNVLRARTRQRIPGQFRAGESALKVATWCGRPDLEWRFCGSPLQPTIRASLRSGNTS